MIRLNEHKYEQLNFNYFSIECYSFRILVGLFSFIHLEFDAYVMNILLNRYHFDMENVAEYVICFSFFLLHLCSSNKESAKMAVSTVAYLLSNSSSLVPATTMSIVAPTSISTTTTTLTMPFLVTSMSHRTLHSMHKASGSHRQHIKDFSPVTLSTEWSSMARLLVLACLSVIGSIGNVFMISSVMIEDHLKKAGE